MTCGHVAAPLLYVTPHLKHFGRFECAKCGKFITWAKTPTNDNGVPMGFQTDGGGLAFKCSDLKISGVGSSTWSTKISHIERSTNRVCIMTYSLPNLEYVIEVLGKRPRDIWIIANSKFMLTAYEIKRQFPEIGVAINEKMHSKVCLIEPKTVWLSSANFGRSGWNESSIGMHSREAYDYMIADFGKAWTESQEIEA